MSALEQTAAAEDRSDPIAVIERQRLLVIVRRAHPEDWIPAALEAGGVRVVEISLAADGAVEAISRWRVGFERLVIGAGTILTPAHAAAAAEAGASFLVSPGLHPGVGDQARRAGVPYIPGALTPTEVHACMASGAPLVKLFPAARLGPGYVRDLRGPFPDLRLMPTGGVDESNARLFLDAGAAAVAVGGGLLASGATPDAVEAAARRLTALISEPDKGSS
jgi:2-dehydro-3-deoxyphosphogluconate aldolase/(4S)-4-hydroxy-2-oxoglutarate aldolase